MSKQCQSKLSLVAKDYLAVFYCIFEQMMRGMTSARLTDSISHNFIVQMIPHHQAAIDMSRNLLRYTTCVPLQNIAEDIITSQTKSIQNMLAAEESCSCLENSFQDIMLYQRRVSRIMDTMFSDMGSAPMTNDVNLNFIQEMIPHHKGAIAMSKNALQYDICPELKPILQAIITSQEKGVRQMEKLRRAMTTDC